MGERCIGLYRWDVGFLWHERSGLIAFDEPLQAHDTRSTGQPRLHHVGLNASISRGRLPRGAHQKLKCTRAFSDHKMGAF
jgi:hypothetical protein